MAFELTEPTPSPPSPPGSPSLRKRTLSSASSTGSAPKRAHSEDPTNDMSDTEGSLGASRLNLTSPSPAGSDDAGDATTTADSDAGQSTPASPPAYEDIDDVPGFLAPVNVPDGPNQKLIIEDLRRGALPSDGDEWWLVSRRWFRRWSTAVSGVAETKEDDPDLGVDRVGPIDNSDIIDDKGGLRKGVREGVDVELLNPASYDLLSTWYRTTGPTFSRPVVNSSVQFYPPTFHFVLLLPSTSTTSSIAIPVDHPHPPSVSLASSKSIADLVAASASAFHTERPVRLWRLATEVTLKDGVAEGDSFLLADKLGEEGAELVIKDGEEVTPQSSLLDALLDAENIKIVVEQQLTDQSWIVSDPSAIVPSTTTTSSSETPAFALPAPPAPTKKLFGTPFFGKDASPATGANSLTPRYTGGNATASGSKEKEKKEGFKFFGGALTRNKSATRGQRGLTGLQNLGNTCFMNSALQCMSNTKELQEYFMSGVYRDEINRDNPLGMNGQVAEAFGQLIERIWSSSGSAFPPREFKQTLARFAPAFTGYGQQDSQELLAFLLDGTHEDLNRILKKPATSSPDWEGGGDKELVEMARVCWEQYRSRNDSVIVDLFQGQYRSTVVCPDCKKVSITFDPFMYVTTNLPVHKKWTGKVYFVPLDTSKPRVALELSLPKICSMKAGKAAIGQHMGVDPRRLVAAEEWKGKFFKPWYDDDMISDITSNDAVIFYETAAPIAHPKPRHFGKKQPPLPPPDANEHIVVPVLHTFRKGKAKKTMFGSRDDGESFGTPFVLSLTPEEAMTEAGIFKALAKQYARVTDKGDELLEFIEDEPEKYDPATFVPAPPAAAPAPAPAPASEAVQLPSPSTTEPNTDMDVDDQSSAALSTISVDPPAYLPSMDVPITEFSSSSSSFTEATTSAPTPTPAPAPTAMPTEPSAAAEDNAVFKMLVSKIRPKDRNLPLGQNDIGGPTVPIASRLNSHLSAAALRTQATSIAPSTVPPVSTTDEDANMASPSPAAPEAPVEPPAPAFIPLVKTGDYIVVEWSAASHAHFFGADDAKLWSKVEEFVDPALKESRLRKAPKKTITLEDCLNEFTKEERLGEDDTWYCPDCKKHQQATKQVEIWKVPDVLIFHLKRFSANRYSRDKLDDLVDFPLESFDMTPFVEGDKVERRLAAAEGSSDADAEPLIYDLYAVDNHYGGLGGGHYTAYAKNHENAQWYDFDDSRVTPIRDPESVKTQAAYLLFYRRRTTRPIGGHKNRELVNSAIQSRNASNHNSDTELGGSRSDTEANSDSEGPPNYLSSMPGPSMARTAKVDEDGAELDEDDLFGDNYPSSSSNSRSFTGIYGASGRLPSPAGSSGSDAAEVGDSPPQLSGRTSPLGWEMSSFTQNEEEDGPVHDVRLNDEGDVDLDAIPGAEEGPQQDPSLMMPGSLEATD